MKILTNVFKLLVHNMPKRAVTHKLNQNYGLKSQIENLPTKTTPSIKPIQPGLARPISFMSDTLKYGRQFNTFNTFAPFHRKAFSTNANSIAPTQPEILEAIKQELENLKTAVQGKRDSQETIYIIDALIQAIRTPLDTEELAVELEFAYSRLESLRHFMKLVHGVHVSEEITLFGKIKAFIKSQKYSSIHIKDDEFPTQQSNQPSEASVLPLQKDDLEKEKRLFEEQQRLHNTPEFLQLLRQVFLYFIENRESSKKLFISYAYPGQPIWYSEKELSELCMHYLGHAFTLNYDNKDSFEKSQLSPEISIIPVNLDGLFWSLIYLSDSGQAFYIDPFNRPIHSNILAQFPEIQRANHLKFDERSYDSGPWIVEVSNYINEHKKIPESVTNMQTAREKHAGIIKSLKAKEDLIQAEKTEIDEPWATEFVRCFVLHLTMAGFQVYLDQFHSCDGYPLGKFMQKIQKVDHVLIMSTRTMDKKLNFDESGVSYEVKQIMRHLPEKNARDRVVIPILLNNRPYYSRTIRSQGLAENQMCQNGYMNSLCNLINRLHHRDGVLAEKFTKFWLDTWLIQNIKRQYLNNNRIELGNGLGESVNIEDGFVRLTLVEEKEQQKKEEELHKAKQEETSSELFQDKRLTSFKDLYETKTAIKIEEILNPSQEVKKPIRRVLVLGRAGVGKSTLCQYLAYRWASGSLWNDKFTVVIWVPLKKILDKNYQATTIKEVILNEWNIKNNSGDTLFTPQHIEALLNRTHPQEILFLLDGCDEVATQANELPEKSTPKGKLIRELLSQTNVIITTRPHRVDEYIKVIDLRLENIGFSDEDIDVSIEKHFRKENEAEVYGQPLKDFLLKNPNVRVMARIPLLLTLICKVWRNYHNRKNLENTTIQINLGFLFQEVVKDLSIRYLKRKCGIDPYGATSPEEIFAHENCKPIIEFMAELAFEQMKEDSLIINSKKLKSIFKKYSLPLGGISELKFEDIAKFGLLKPQETGQTIEDDRKSYYFIHLTFQEFLAAYYIVQRLKVDDGEIKEFISTHKYVSQYEITWWFVASLLKDDQPILENFFDIIEAEPRDIIGLYHQMLMMRCLDECSLQVEEDKKQKFITNLCNFLEIESSYKALSTPIIIQYLAISPNVFGQTQVAKWFLAFFNDVRNQSSLYFIFRNHRIPPMPPKLLISLAELLPYNYSSENKMSERILSCYSVFPIEVLHRLVSFLKFENKRFQIAVVKIMKRQLLLPSEILDQLAELLRHRSVTVCYSVAQILENHKNLPIQIHYYLLDLLLREDTDIEDLKFAKVHAVATLTNQTVLLDIIQKKLYELLLVNKNINIQLYAAQVLISHNAFIKEIECTLMDVLHNGNHDFRIKASALIGYLGQRTMMESNTVYKLVDLWLLDEDSDVRFNALLALSCQSVLPDELLDILLEMLVSDTRIARDSEKILSGGAFITHQKFMDRVVNLLNNENNGIRERSLVILSGGYKRNKLEWPINILVRVVDMFFLRGRDEDLVYNSEKAISPEINYRRDQLFRLWVKAASILNDQSALPAEIIDRLMIFSRTNTHVRYARLYVAKVLAGRGLKLPVEALDLVILYMSSTWGFDREEATMILKTQLELPKKAMDRLLIGLQSQHKGIQESSAEALEFRPALPSEIVDRLIVMLHDKDVRGRAASALCSQMELSHQNLIVLVDILNKNSEERLQNILDIIKAQSILHIYSLININDKQVISQPLLKVLIIKIISEKIPVYTDTIEREIIFGNKELKISFDNETDLKRFVNDLKQTFTEMTGIKDTRTQPSSTSSFFPTNSDIKTPESAINDDPQDWPKSNSR